MCSACAAVPFCVKHTRISDGSVTSWMDIFLRLLYAAQRTAAAGSVLRLQHDRPADLAADELTLLDRLDERQRPGES